MALTTDRSPRNKRRLPNLIRERAWAKQLHSRLDRFFRGWLHGAKLA